MGLCGQYGKIEVYVDSSLADEELEGGYDGENEMECEGGDEGDDEVGVGGPCCDI